MSRSLRWNLSWMVLSLLCVGCNTSTSTVAPLPTGSPPPPFLAGRGTLAVVDRGDPNVRRILIFPPHSDTVAREILIHGSQFVPNSLTFDRRAHLYIGYDDTSRGGQYHVLEVNLPNFDVARTISFPAWANSSVATDDQSNLYVNTKAFIGGDINVFRNNRETRPFLEIKDHRSPLTTLVTHDALWVGYEGVPTNALARYRLRSTDRTWFQSIGDDVPRTLAVNSDGSLIAAFVKRNSGRAVDVIDVKSGKVARTLLEGGGLGVMTGDGSQHIYISEALGGQSGDGKIYACTFRGCTFSFETTSGKAMALAVSPLDGMLYVAFNGKSNIGAYDPRTGKLVMRIALPGSSPTVLAIEP